MLSKVWRTGGVVWRALSFLKEFSFDESLNFGGFGWMLEDCWAVVLDLFDTNFEETLPLTCLQH